LAGKEANQAQASAGAEQFVERGESQIRIHEQNSMAKLSERNCQVASHRGLTFGWLGARDQKRARRPVGGREQNRSTEPAKRFDQGSMLRCVAVDAVPERARVFARAISVEGKSLGSREESMNSMMLAI